MSEIVIPLVSAMIAAAPIVICEKGWLPMEIWKIWEDELVRTLQTPLFVREWQQVCREFESYPEFKQYVEEAQGGLTADTPDPLK